MTTLPTLSHLALTTMLSTMITTEAIEKLKETDWYRRDLKVSGERFLKELEKVWKVDMDKVFGLSNETDLLIYELYWSMKDFMKEIILMRPEDVGAVQKLIAMYKENPEFVLSTLKIPLGTS